MPKELYICPHCDSHSYKYKCHIKELKYCSRICWERYHTSWNKGKKREDMCGEKHPFYGKPHPNRGKKVHSSEFKRRLILYNHSRKGRFKHSEESKDKMSKKRKGVLFSEEHKKNLRKSTINYLRKQNCFICPRIGKNEKVALDRLSKVLGFRILRQYEVEGYYLDGYIPSLRLAIEIDEHPKITKRDISRQNFIEKRLNCTFLRLEEVKS